MKKATLSLRCLAVLAAVALIGVLIYKIALPPIQRARLLAQPRPLPKELVTVRPAPGSHVVASAFNQIPVGSNDLRRGEVCLEVYDGLLGLDLGNRLPIESIALQINKRPAGAFWAEGGKLDAVIEHSTRWDLNGALHEICWPVVLNPGDYLAELSVRGIKSTLVYEWAFRITGE